jgi:hypothetical protein
MIVHGFHLHATAWQEKFWWPKTLMYVDERGWPLSHSQVWSSNEQSSARLRVRYAFAPNYIALLSLAIKRRAWLHWSSGQSDSVSGQSQWVVGFGPEQLIRWQWVVDTLRRLGD